MSLKVTYTAEFTSMKLYVPFSGLNQTLCFGGDSDAGGGFCIYGKN